jgi:hypothetical protein
MFDKYLCTPRKGKSVGVCYHYGKEECENTCDYAQKRIYQEKVDQKINSEIEFFGRLSYQAKLEKKPSELEMISKT